MPSFRDLKGKPVEEVVDSRTLPGLPDPGEQMAERETVRAAVEKMTANRSGRFSPPDDRISQESGVEPAFERARLDGNVMHFLQPVPEDMAQALAELDAKVAVMVEHARSALAAAEGILAGAAAIRARAEKDSAKLAKLNEMLAALRE